MDGFDLQSEGDPDNLPLTDFARSLGALDRSGSRHTRFPVPNLDALDAHALEERVEHDAVPISETVLEALMEHAEGPALTLDGRPLLLYPARIGHRQSKPRFHLCHCDAVASLRQRERAAGNPPRFRISRSANPTLLVERYQRLNQPEEEFIGAEWVRFVPCRECLALLRYRGFQLSGNPVQLFRNQRIAASFDLAAYLGVRGGHEGGGSSADGRSPSAGADGQPYSDSGHRLDRKPYWDALKRASGFSCSACGLRLEHHRSWLTLHHRNRRPRDDRRANLIPLCVGCHSLQEGEGHRSLRETDEFQEFVRHHPRHPAAPQGGPLYRSA